MSGQDSQICEICGKPCGYDDNKAYYDPGYICGVCKANLIKRFSAVFGLEGSSDEYGIQVKWREAIAILGKLKRDESMRISYFVTDKEMWEKTVERPISVLEA